MKRSLYVAFFFMGVILASALWIGKEVNSGKETIVITEEIMSGNPREAEGVTLEITSGWNRNLFWDTSYTIGSGDEAETDFSFYAQKANLYSLSPKTAKMEFSHGANFGSAIVQSGQNVNPENFPFPDIIREVAERAAAGEKYSETVSIGEYYPYYSVEFRIEGSSVEYEGDYCEEMDYLTELFHIPAAEDRIEITVEKDAFGNLSQVSGQMRVERGERTLSGASAFGDEGCYYAYCCSEVESGRRADKGENCGIFYLPFRDEEGMLHVNLMQMEKICPLPENVTPAGMYLDKDGRRLYLAGRETKDDILLVYELDGTNLIPVQRIPILWDDAAGQNAFYGDSAAEEGVWPEEGWGMPPQFRAMTRENGGMLITWSDNRFAFVAEENGECRLWCTGFFPTGKGTQEDMPAWWNWEEPFPGERQCIFDGERLVLAAFESWESLNVLVAVYRGEGEVYSARYRYGGALEPAVGYDSMGRIVPLSDYFPRFQGEGREIFLLGANGAKKPLSLKGK